MPALKDYWLLVLEDLKTKLTPSQFKTWFALSEFVEMQESGRKIVITVPSDFHKQYIDRRFRKELLESIAKYYPQVIHIVYKIVKPPETEQKVQQSLTLEPAADAANDKSIEDNSEPEKISTYLPKKSLNNLNPKYTFENFVVTRSNELAAGVANAIIAEIGKLYNPLFIHSKVGLGKTHLLQAIGNKTLEVKPNYNIKYIPAETFINQWIISLQRKETNYFREYYNSIDLLLIDDIQFFAGKESTQEVFFHIFNYLHQNNKQIVLTSDKPPQDLIGIPERLVSRFNSGMVVDIFPPELEDRLSILKDKVARLNLPLDDQKIFKIAQAINTNIRDLEGVLNKIQARIRLMPHLEFTDQELESLLSAYQGQITNPDLLTKSIDTVTPETILQTVCRLFSIDKSDLLGSSREKNVALARQIAFWLCKHELDLSYPVIGKLFGGRNHTTVMHGYNKIQELLQNDHKIKDKIILAKKILSKQC